MLFRSKIATDLNIPRTTVVSALASERFAKAGKDGKSVLFDLSESVINDVTNFDDFDTQSPDTHDSTPHPNNEVGGVQSTLNEENDVTTNSVSRGVRHSSHAVMSSDEDIF